MKPVRGALLVFEGCDRAGKSTQVKRLVEALTDKGIPVKSRSFPDRTTQIGRMINQFLWNKVDLAPEVVHLLFAANRWECKEDILKELQAGTTLIVDRYAASGTAYTAANTGRPLFWCQKADEGLPAPDLVFFLDVTLEDQTGRKNWGNEKFEKMEFQQKVATNYRQLQNDSWVVIESKGSIEDIHSKVLAKTMEVMEKVKYKAIKELECNEN